MSVGAAAQGGMIGNNSASPIGGAGTPVGATQSFGAATNGGTSGTTASSGGAFTHASTPYITNCVGANGFAVAMIDPDSDLHRLTPTATRLGAYSSTGRRGAEPQFVEFLAGATSCGPSKRFCMPPLGDGSDLALSSAVIDHLGLGNSTARAGSTQRILEFS
jgi:hypothetical protein